MTPSYTGSTTDTCIRLSLQLFNQTDANHAITGLLYVQVVWDAGRPVVQCSLARKNYTFVLWRSSLRLPQSRSGKIVLRGVLPIYYITAYTIICPSFVNTNAMKSERSKRGGAHAWNRHGVVVTTRSVTFCFSLTHVFVNLYSLETHRISDFPNLICGIN